MWIINCFLMQNFSVSGSSDSPQPWCNIAYWELSNRVGRLLPVCQPVINVFADLPHGDGLCLETLAQSRFTDNPSVLQTRSKIGQGITIFREDQQVWVYNRSEFPVFVNSPTLDPPNTENLTVYKVLPGYCIKIFDYERSLYNQRLHDPSLLKDGPFDPYAVRISFAKGWGSSKYSRRFVTSCPCWLEVIFRVNRWQIQHQHFWLCCTCHIFSRIEGLILQWLLLVELSTVVPLCRPLQGRIMIGAKWIKRFVFHSWYASNLFLGSSGFHSAEMICLVVEFYFEIYLFMYLFRCGLFHRNVL